MSASRFFHEIIGVGTGHIPLRGRLGVLLLLLTGAPLFPSGAAAADSWSVISPNGEVKVSVSQRSGAPGQPNRLYYRVEQGKEGSRAVIIKESPLGLRLQGQDYVDGLRLVKAPAQKLIEEDYTMPHGKRRVCRNRANEQALLFENGDGQPFEVDLRAYDNGVAFRYRLPAGLTGTQTLESEVTGFGLPADARIWCAPSDKPSTYAPAYETYYGTEMDASMVAPLGFGWSFPLLFRTGDSRHWALITEANVDGRFCGARLSSAAANGVFSIALPDPAEGNGQGSVKPSSTLPWEMPWRVIVVGNSLGTIAESTLVTDVSSAAAVKDIEWVKPGRVAWSWWSDNPSPKNAASQCKFVDLAAEMGWEYVLVDANWTIMENGNLQEVLKYAKGKGVGVLLWYNSGGPHNVVTEKPRDCLTYRPVRQFELGLLRDWGVKGVKVDFFQSDKQEVMGLYQGILEDAAEKQIMVNFHGCTLPRGWERKYPHLMSMEAVRGEECYIFDPKYPESAPVQNTILPFTRNAVGPMDYTPVGFSNNRYPHRTTSAHELALAVLFETGWLHFADKPEAYLQLPPGPKQFLKEVPVAWDDTRFVDGYPGQFAILARLKGNRWYVAGVNGENRRREVSLKPDGWLPAGDYELTIISDGEDPHAFTTQTRPFQAGQELKLGMLPYGGFIAVLKSAR